MGFISLPGDSGSAELEGITNIVINESAEQSFIFATGAEVYVLKEWEVVKTASEDYVLPMIWVAIAAAMKGDDVSPGGIQIGWAISNDGGATYSYWTELSAVMGSVYTPLTEFYNDDVIPDDTTHIAMIATATGVLADAAIKEVRGNMLITPASGVSLVEV